MITQKIKKNISSIVNFEKNKGFVLLFAVMLSSIVLAISLGVANIALKEINFTTSTKDTNNAFYAADIGAECALLGDKVGTNKFTPDNYFVTCLGADIYYVVGDWNTGPWDFPISGLGSSGIACSKVTVTKTDMGGGSTLTTITSKGYNNGGGVPDLCTPDSKSVERELQVTYY
ncbi:MAG: hypothetical protein WAV23_00105 [Minisyncoccia bacterium]